MALVTLQTIFQEAFPAYEQTHPPPAHVRRAARAIMQCRTAALGGHASVSRWPYVPHLVQLLSASIAPAMCLPPD